MELLSIDQQLQPLGAVAWAAAEKHSGWMPEGIIARLRTKSRFQNYHLEALEGGDPLTPARLNLALRAATIRAERLIAALPRGLAYGALLRPDGSLARPDPDRPETLEGLVVHHGSRKGSWPSSPEIGSVMLRERPLPR